MLQNPCKTLGFKKNMVYEIPPGGGEVNHITGVFDIINALCALFFSKLCSILLAQRIAFIITLTAVNL